MAKTTYVKTAAFACLAFILAVSLVVTAGYQKAFADTTYTKADASTSTQTGQGLYSGRPMFLEYFGGDGGNLLYQEIDSITLKLRKGGSPTGNFEVYMGDYWGNKYLSFGNMSASSLTTSYTEYTFSLPNNVEEYLVQLYDAIVIKYTGGDSNNNVQVMRSNIGSAGVDYEGTNAYNVYWENSQAHVHTDRDVYFRAANTVSSADDNCNQLTSTYDLDGFNFVWNNTASVLDCIPDSSDELTAWTQFDSVPSGWPASGNAEGAYGFVVTMGYNAIGEQYEGNVFYQNNEHGAGYVPFVGLEGHRVHGGISNNNCGASVTGWELTSGYGDPDEVIGSELTDELGRATLPTLTVVDQVTDDGQIELYSLVVYDDYVVDTIVNEGNLIWWGDNPDYCA